MLATIGGFGLALISLIYSLFAKKFWLTNFVIGASAIWLVIYVSVLLGVSLTSKEKILGLNQPKEFCGSYLDCHLHAAVTGVRTAKIIGNQTAQGIFYIVKVEVFNDARRATLNLIETKAEVQDEGSRFYSRCLEAEEELGEASAPDFSRSVPPQGGFEKEIVFDITEPARELKLSITEGYGVDKVIEAFLIGDEDSIFHQPTLFRITPQTQTATVN